MQKEHIGRIRRVTIPEQMREIVLALGAGAATTLIALGVMSDRKTASAQDVQKALSDKDTNKITLSAFPEEQCTREGYVDIQIRIEMRKPGGASGTTESIYLDNHGEPVDPCDPKGAEQFVTKPLEKSTKLGDRVLDAGQDLSFQILSPPYTGVASRKGTHDHGNLVLASYENEFPDGVKIADALLPPLQAEGLDEGQMVAALTVKDVNGVEFSPSFSTIYAEGQSNVGNDAFEQLVSLYLGGKGIARDQIRFVRSIAPENKQLEALGEVYQVTLVSGLSVFVKKSIVNGSPYFAEVIVPRAEDPKIQQMLELWAIQNAFGVGQVVQFSDVQNLRDPLTGNIARSSSLGERLDLLPSVGQSTQIQGYPARYLFDSKTVTVFIAADMGKFSPEAIVIQDEGQQESAATTYMSADQAVKELVAGNPVSEFMLGAPELGITIRIDEKSRKSADYNVSDGELDDLQYRVMTQADLAGKVYPKISIFQTKISHVDIFDVALIQKNGKPESTKIALVEFKMWNPYSEQAESFYGLIVGYFLNFQSQRFNEVEKLLQPNLFSRKINIEAVLGNNLGLNGLNRFIATTTQQDYDWSQNTPNPNLWDDRFAGLTMEGNANSSNILSLLSQGLVLGTSGTAIHGFSFSS